MQQEIIGESHRRQVQVKISFACIQVNEISSRPLILSQLICGRVV